MAAAKEKSKELYIEPISEYVETDRVTTLREHIDGCEFSWQNRDQNERGSWRNWRPVRRDTDLGKRVSELLGEDLGTKSAGINADSNFFHKSGDTVLAYTTVKLYNDVLKGDQAAADAQMASVGEYATKQVRHVQISEGVKK